MALTEFLIRKLTGSNNLDENDIRAIEALPVHVRDFEPQVPIVRQGDRPSHSCLLIEGFACRSKTTKTGLRQILSIHVPGDVPDLQSLHLRVMDYDLVALSACKVGLIAHDAIRRLTRARPAVADALWRETLVDASMFREWIVNVGSRPAPARLAHLIMELREKLEAVGLPVEDGFELPLTQADLADALGLTHVHLNRVIKALRAEGVLDFRRQMVSLGDARRLLEVSGFDDLYLHQEPNS